MNSEQEFEHIKKIAEEAKWFVRFEEASRDRTTHGSTKMRRFIWRRQSADAYNRLKAAVAAYESAKEKEL